MPSIGDVDPKIDMLGNPVERDLKSEDVIKENRIQQHDTDIEELKWDVNRLKDKTCIVVYLSASQANIADNTFTQIEFNTIDIDCLNEFDTTAYSFTATQAGRYLVTFNLRVSSLNADKTISSLIIKNGVEVAQVLSGNSQSAVTTTNNTTIVDLIVGDILTFKGYHNNGDAVPDFDGALKNTRVSIHRI